MVFFSSKKFLRLAILSASFSIIPFNTNFVLPLLLCESDLIPLVSQSSFTSSGGTSSSKSSTLPLALTFATLSPYLISLHHDPSLTSLSEV